MERQTVSIGTCARALQSPPAYGRACARLAIEIDAALSARLRRLAEARDVTLATTLGAGLAILLLRCKGCDALDLVTERSQSEWVGEWRRENPRSSVALKDALQQDGSTLDLLRRMDELTVLDSATASAMGSKSGSETAVCLAFAERADGIFASADLGAIELGDLSCESASECWRTLLRSMADDCRASVHHLPMMTREQWNEVVFDFNRTAAPFPHESLIHELFEAQVIRTPDVIAVMCEEHSVTFAQLNARANRLARLLRQKGVGRNQPVGVFLERSVELVVGILGVLKAGGAYMPLDPTHPRERLLYPLEDSAARIVLTQQRLASRLPPEAGEVIVLDSLVDEHDLLASDNLDSRELGARSDDLAYVIYTSGSTGRPKGVMIEHRNALSLWQGLEHAFRQSLNCRRVAVNASFTFDASVKQLLELLSGRTLVIVPHTVRLDPHRLLRFFEDNAIDEVDCTPSQLRAWLAAGLLERGGCGLRAVLIGGESIDADLWSVLARCCEVAFFNVYGPTECTVDASWTRVERGSLAPHIGRPLENRQIYVLDTAGHPVPIGVAGEICIGGAGVARGYLNEPSLTADKFVDLPLCAAGTIRVYKSGDIGRWRCDGSIEYLGRNDQQVKLRGFRIELGEIEVLLCRHPSLQQAVVTTLKGASGQARLVAYVVSRGAPPPSEAQLRAYLLGQVPEYMVPQTWIFLQSLPLSPNGKIDRRALPSPAEWANRLPYEPPRGEVEEFVAEIWADVLEVKKVGRFENFFALGGSSLLAMRVMARLSHSLELELPFDVVFGTPTIESMCRRLLEVVSVEQATEGA